MSSVASLDLEYVGRFVYHVCLFNCKFSKVFAVCAIRAWAGIVLACGGKRWLNVAHLHNWDMVDEFALQIAPQLERLSTEELVEVLRGLHRAICPPGRFRTEDGE